MTQVVDFSEPVPKVKKAKSKSLRQLVSERQIQLQTNRHYKNIVVASLLLFCFVDVLGTFLFMPAGPILCQRAEGGPIDQQAGLLLLPSAAVDLRARGMKEDYIALHNSLEATRGSLSMAQARTLVFNAVGNPKAFSDTPFGFSTSINFLVFVSSLSQGVGQAVVGKLSDQVGRKILMLVCICGSLVGYLLIWLSGVFWSSYWGYCMGQVVNGLFSTSFVLVNAFFLDIFTKEEAEGPNAMVMSISVLGGAAGSLILFPFITGRGDNVFGAAWIGVGGTVVAFALVLLAVVEPRQVCEKERKLRASIVGRAQERPQVNQTVTQVLWITIVASALDSAGDEGTRIARGTILQNVWPVTNDIMFQNYLLLSLTGLLFLVLGLMGFFKKFVGMGGIVTIGSFFTVLTQFLLNAKIVKWESHWAFLGMWYGGKLFGMMSTFGAFFIVNELAPEDSRGQWSGLLQGLGGCVEATATVVIASVYDAFNDGSEDGVRGVNAMFVTVSISTVAMIAYWPLAFLMPRAIDKEAQKSKFLTTREYEALSETEYRRLTLEEIDYQEMLRMEEGKLPRTQAWGNYSDEVHEIEGMLARAPADFEYMKRSLMVALMDSNRLEEDRDMMVQATEQLQKQLNMEEQRHEMGQWIADYFMDAGYIHWYMFPQMYKTMLINAFPPIDVLDNQELDMRSADLEHVYLKFLKVADTHIAARRKHLPVFARWRTNRRIRV